LAKRSGDEAVQLKLTTDEDGEVLITIGNNVITFGVRAYEQLDTGLLEISGELVVLELFSDGILTDKCTILRVWDIPYHYEGFCCDEIPPVVEVSALPEPNSKGWNKEVVTVSMTAEDEEGGSGITAIYYVVTGAVIRIGEDALGFAEAGRIATYSFDLDEDGTYEPEFWAEDQAGNESAHGSLTVRIDKISPLIEASRSPSPNEYGWNNADVTVSFHCSDSLSGVASCTSTQQITHEGKGQSVTGVAVDKADNHAETSVENINIDKTKPNVSVSPYSPLIREGETIRLTIEASDSGSGIAYVMADDSSSGRISLGRDGDRWTGSLRPSQSGRITITVTDRAGNVTPRSVSYTVHYDPAKFDVRNLLVTLEKPSHEGTKATIHCTIKNTGGRSDEQSIRLHIDGDQQGSQRVALAPGKSQNVSFSYVFPQAGEYSVKVKSDDDSETASVAVLSPAQLEVSARTRDFGEVDVGSSPSWSFTITNSGDAELKGTIRCSSGDCAAFTFSPSSFSLGKQETSRITVRFSPSQVKEYSAVMVIESNGGDASIRLVGGGKTITVLTLSGHSDWIFSVAFSPDGKLVASGSQDGTIRFWQVDTGHGLHTLTGHNGSSVCSVAFSPDGKLVASGAWDDTVRVWKYELYMDMGNLVHTLDHDDTVFSVAFSPDGKLLASGSGSWDKTIKLWQVDTGNLVRTLSGHWGGVRSVAFSPDGKLLASGGGDNTIKLWNVTTGAEVRTLSDWAFSVAFSPDGKLLASGGDDNTIKLWNVTTGAEVRTLSGHSDWVFSVAFSPDGKLLASGSGDNTIKLWDVTTGAEVRTLSGHSDWVTSVAFSPDGKLLVSGSDDKTIRVWNLIDLVRK
jgi:WD40 repeat protein